MGEFIIMVFEMNIQCIFTQLLSLKQHTLRLKPNPNIAMFPSALATVMNSHKGDSRVIDSKTELWWQPHF